MPEILVQIGRGDSLMDFSTAEKLVSALNRYSYTPAIYKIDGAPERTSCAVVVLANEGQDFDFLALQLSNMQVDWQVVEQSEFVPEPEQELLILNN